MSRSRTGVHSESQQSEILALTSTFADAPVRLLPPLMSSSCAQMPGLDAPSLASLYRQPREMPTRGNYSTAITPDCSSVTG